MHKRISPLALLTAGISVAVALCVPGVRSALAQALVIDGEQIADAATMAAARNEGKLVVFGTFPTGPMRSILNAFRKDTGISFDHMRLTTQKMFPRVTAEFAAGRLEADFIDLTDITLIKKLVELGILNHPHRVPSFDLIPAAIKDPQGRWYALIRPVSVIAVNTALVKPADYPTSWNDLFKPMWKGKIGMPSVDAGGSAFTLYTFLREDVGRNYWARLAAQKPRIFPAISPTVTDLVRGESAIAIGGASQVLNQIKSKAPVRIIFPKEGISSFPISGGMTTTGKHPHATAVFLNWMTSKRGGTFIGSAGAYPAHPEARPPKPHGVAFPPQNKVWNLGLDHWEKVRGPYTSEWRATFGTK